MAHKLLHFLQSNQETMRLNELQFKFAVNLIVISLIYNQSNSNMQLRLSIGNPGPFNGNIVNHLRKQKQQAVFTYHNKDIPPKNIYYDTNPYFLHLSPSEQRLKTPVSISRNSSHARDYSQSHSQRSCKVIRANGLKLVQKPKIGRVQQQSPVSNGRLNEQTRRFMQRQLELQNQNKILKGQNQYLKQKLRQMQAIKNKQINRLQQKIQKLQQLTFQLEHKIEQSQAQWQQQVKKIKSLQYSDF